MVTDIKPQKTERPIFPFTAIIGQEEMKLALILNVIDPRIGGVMIMGDRGTGKSTTIRAVADLLPEIRISSKKRQHFFYPAVTHHDTKLGWGTHIWFDSSGK